VLNALNPELIALTSVLKALNPELIALALVLKAPNPELKAREPVLKALSHGAKNQGKSYLSLDLYSVYIKGFRTYCPV
jgi:hypothetical protein